MTRFLLFLFFLTGVLFSQDKPITPADSLKTPADSTKKGTSKDTEKSFEDVIKECKTIQGLFTIYLKEDENKAYLEIKPDQLDTLFLCNVTLEAGDGYYFDSGAMLDAFPFFFQKIGKKIQLIHKNVYYRADPKSPIARAVKRGVSSSVIASASIEGKPHPDRKSFLVDLSSLFLQDYEMIGNALSDKKVNYSFDKSESYLGLLKSFPMNTEIETVLSFKNSNPKPTNQMIADSRSMLHRYRYSLSTLPQNGYRPRFADDRIGHFMTMYQDYTNLADETAFKRYVNRWNLEKKNPGATLSEPKEPIVFWLENTIPFEYREALKNGVLAWNKAFEKIGFKNALVVKQMPDDADWDPADVRYNTLRWMVKPGDGYAVGPSRTDPFTGQIYDADIRFSADMIRYAFREFDEVVEPGKYFHDAGGNLEEPPFLNLMNCTYAKGAIRQLAFGFSILEAREHLTPSSDAAKKYVNEFLTHVAAHEVGHTLGLRHNFRASTSQTMKSIQDRSITAAEGITGSLMDYIPVNLAPKDARQGQYWQTNVGTYDFWAIEYAYKPISGKTPEDELGELSKIASRVAEPKLAYGTDEDGFGFAPQGMDPVTNVWDLSDEPMAYYETRIALADEILTTLEKNFETKGQRYQKLRMVFGQAIREYFLASATVSKFVGGMYHRRDHVGDPNGRLPFEPVPAEKQLAALTFINTHILGPEAFRFSPDLLNKLASERFYDFDFSIFYQPRADYPVHDIVLAIQRFAIDRMFHPIVLNRILDMQLHYKTGEKVFQMEDLFSGVRTAVWSELETGKNINSFRRNLQRSHLDRISWLALHPMLSAYYTPSSGSQPAGYFLSPQDASTLARADLIQLRGAIETVLKMGGLDTMTRAHLDDCLTQINATVDAKGIR
ncbi:MAG: zinc-dependent metalloprotease [Bacteroidetes bacterium]|nr:zinc-dependent metalloprotease [Bacteroidota bacterium]